MATNSDEEQLLSQTKRPGSGEIQFQGCDLNPALAICICPHKPSHAPNRDRILARLAEAGTDLSCDFSLLLDVSGREDVLLFFGNRETLKTFKLLVDTLWSLRLANDSQEKAKAS